MMKEWGRVRGRRVKGEVKEGKVEGEKREIGIGYGDRVGGRGV